MFSVVTSRFNNETLNANYAYRKKQNFKCMYCAPLELSPKILYNTPVFVVEMNNETNKIQGIGLIKNSLVSDIRHKVYDNGEYNRYIYRGNYWISREDLLILDPEIIEIFDNILFK